MRNSPLKAFVKKSPLQINPNYDQWYYNPKTQLKLDKKKKTKSSNNEPSNKSLSSLVTKKKKSNGIVG